MYICMYTCIILYSMELVVTDYVSSYVPICLCIFDLFVYTIIHKCASARIDLAAQRFILRPDFVAFAYRQDALRKIGWNNRITNHIN